MKKGKLGKLQILHYLSIVSNILQAKYVSVTVNPEILNTSEEFIKRHILHFLIMECCRYLFFLLNDYMELFKTVSAHSWLFISQMQRFT